MLSKQAIVSLFGMLLLQAAQAKNLQGNGAHDTGALDTSGDDTSAEDTSTYIMDLDWPDADCCRIYRNMEFQIRPTDSLPEGQSEDWKDVCSEGTTKTIDLSSDEYWNNEVQSYKCGSNTWIKFCEDADSDTCDEFYKGESGAGGSESQDLGLHDQHSKITVTWYDPVLQPAATVYSMTKCHGHQSIIWMDVGELTTGDKYTDLHDSIDLPDYSLEYEFDPKECEQDPPGIASVLFPPGTGYWMQLFNEPGFEGSNQVVNENNSSWTSCNDFGGKQGIYCSGALASSLIFAESPAFEPIQTAVVDGPDV